MNIKNFLEEVDENIDVIFIIFDERDMITEKTANRINELKEFLYKLAHIINKICPDAEIYYNVQTLIVKGYIVVNVITDEGDWIEINTVDFSNCIKYADEFKITPISEDQMELIFLLKDFL